MRVEEDVARFHVAVNRVGRVDGHEAPADAFEDAEGDIELGRSAALEEPLLQRGALHELHDEEGHSVVLTKRVDLQHVRMAHARHRARLVAEALAHVVANQVRLNELDRDVPVETLVVGKQDDAHPAAAKLPENSIPASDQGPRRRTGGHELGARPGAARRRLALLLIVEGAPAGPRPSGSVRLAGGAGSSADESPWIGERLEGREIQANTCSSSRATTRPASRLSRRRGGR